MTTHLKRYYQCNENSVDMFPSTVRWKEGKLYVQKLVIKKGQWFMVNEHSQIIDIKDTL